MAANHTGLRLLTKPASEPVSLDIARRHLRLDQDGDDALLQLYIRAAREHMEWYLDRACFKQQWRFNVTWAPPPTATPLVPQSLIVFPLNWPPLVKHPVTLHFAPNTKVERIFWGPLDDLHLADPNDYIVNLGVDPGYVAVKPQILPNIPQQTMSIEYWSGFSDAEDPDDVPGAIILAILELTAFVYENRGELPVDMPMQIRNLVNPWRLWKFAGAG